MPVGIVGAGVSGLATHHYLRERGIDSVVFEAAAEPGGVVRSARVEGRVLDFGPQRTRRTPEIDALIATLGLGDSVIEAADVPLYVYHDGRLRTAPLSVRGAVATDLLSQRGKLRALAEPLADPPRDGETVAAFLERSFGREAARRVLEPLYAGLYGSDPEEMYAEYTLSKLFENHGITGSVLASVARRLLGGAEAPPAITFDDGMQALPRALYRRHRDSVRLGTPVTGIERAEGGYRLEIGGGTGDGIGDGVASAEDCAASTDDCAASVADGGSIDIDAVVLTTPAGVTADLVERVDPASAGNLRRLNYNPLAVVHLRSADDLTGAGYQFSIDEADDWRTRGVTWNAGFLRRGDPESGTRDRSDGREGLYTCYLGGSNAPAVAEWSDDRLADVAAREFEAVTDRSARPLSVRRLSPGMPAYDTSWTALEGIDLPDGIHLCTNYAARAGIPGRVREAKRLAGDLAAAAGDRPAKSAATARSR